MLHINNSLDKLNQKYIKYLLVGDFNAEDLENFLSNFFFELNTKSIVNNYTCYKSVKNPSFIGFIITNSPMSSQDTVNITTVLSDFPQNGNYCYKSNVCKVNS